MWGVPRGQGDELVGPDNYRCLELAFPSTSYRRKKRKTRTQAKFHGAGCQRSPAMPETWAEWTHTGTGMRGLSESLGSGLRTGLRDHAADLPVCQSLQSSEKFCDLSWGYWVKVTLKTI